MNYDTPGIDPVYMELMNKWWIQPGVALHLHSMSHDVRDFPFKGPSVDISCGDGTFTFICQGGRFDLHGETVIEKPQGTVSVGTEFRQHRLDLAQKLDFYDTLTLHNNNDVPFPFEDEYFQTVYHNALYFAADPLTFLKEIRRAMVPGAKGLFQVWTNHFPAQYSHLKQVLDPNMMDSIDIFKNCGFPYVAHDLATWRDIFHQAGFIEDEVRSCHVNTEVTMACCLDFKIVFEEMYQIINSLDPKVVEEVKPSWVKKLGQALYPMTKAKPGFAIEDSAYLSFFVTA